MHDLLPAMLTVAATCVLQIVKKVELEAQRAAGGRAGAGRRKRNPIEDLKREVAIMRKLRHKNITALQEVQPRPSHSSMRRTRRRHARIAFLFQHGCLFAIAGMLSIARSAGRIRVGEWLTCAAAWQVVDDPSGNKMLLVMEYMEGGPVMTREALERGRCIPEALALQYFRDMCKVSFARILYIQACVPYHVCACMVGPA